MTRRVKTLSSQTLIPGVVLNTRMYHDFGEIDSMLRWPAQHSRMRGTPTPCPSSSRDITPTLSTMQNSFPLWFRASSCPMSRPETLRSWVVSSTALKPASNPDWPHEALPWASYRGPVAIGDFDLRKSYLRVVRHSWE